MMPPRRRARRDRARPGTALGGILVIALLGGVFALAPHAARAADAPGDGGNLSVTVTDDPTDTPSPTASVGSTIGGTDGAATGGGGSSGGGGGSAPNSGGGAPAGAPAPAAGEVSVGGMLYVGGLNASSTPTSDPADGVVTLWFTVRNASTSPITAKARFWMNSMLLPHQLDAVEDVVIPTVKPGETAVATARLHRGGQWTLLSAHATLTPPKSVDGVALSPMTRDAHVVLVPWLLLLIALGAIVVAVAVRVVHVVRVHRAAAQIATEAA